jgi:hypothetical protein
LFAFKVSVFYGPHTLAFSAGIDASLKVWPVSVSKIASERLPAARAV